MLQTTKHREVMYALLQDIYSTRYANTLALKWWTLCYFLYKLDRFSTDLDFDLIKEVDDEAIFLKTIEDILKKYWKIKEQSKKRYTYFFLLSYWEDDMNIKIEINNRIWKSNIYEVVNFFWLNILAMEKSSIFANKLVALTDRKRVVNRDIYDIYFFFENMFDINEGVIVERTGKNLKEYLEYLLDFIGKNVNKRNLLDWLGEVLDNKQKSFVKEKLLDKLIQIITFKINF